MSVSSCQICNSCRDHKAYEYIILVYTLLVCAEVRILGIGDLRTGKDDCYHRKEKS